MLLSLLPQRRLRGELVPQACPLGCRCRQGPKTELAAIHARRYRGQWPEPASGSPRSCLLCTQVPLPPLKYLPNASLLLPCFCAPSARWPLMPHLPTGPATFRFHRPPALSCLKLPVCGGKCRKSISAAFST